MFFSIELSARYPLQVRPERNPSLCGLFAAIGFILVPAFIIAAAPLINLIV